MHIRNIKRFCEIQVSGTDVLKKYKFLLDFASTKPLTALIMYELFNRKKSLHPTVKSVSGVACQEELRNLEYARFFYHSL